MRVECRRLTELVYDTAWNREATAAVKADAAAASVAAVTMV